MWYNMMLQFVYVFCNVQIRVVSLLITLDVYHFFMVKKRLYGE